MSTKQVITEPYPKFSQQTVLQKFSNKTSLTENNPMNLSKLTYTDFKNFNTTNRDFTFYNSKVKLNNF
jgi:hypothetical protein